MAINSNDSDAQDSSIKDDEKILEEAKARFQLAQEAESNNRNNGLDDLEFLNGDQWHDADKNSRRDDGRPCLTINKLPQVINQVTNDQRQNRPDIKVNPVDDNADVATAKVIQGLIRNIEYNSNSEAAYDTAFEFAAKMGWGYWRIITQYSSPTSFEQDIIIKRVPNPFAISFDPYSVEPDGSDANFAFIEESISKEEFKRLYPDSETAESDEWTSIGNSESSWMRGDSCRVAEYFYKELRDAKIMLLSNGKAVLESELPRDLGMDKMGQPIHVVNQRVTKIPKICWVKMTGIEILERTDWPGQYIPIVPVFGSDSNINGNRILKGIVRDAKDSARMYNYFASAEAEAVALAPKAPFIADPKQIEGYESIWASANRKNHAFLPYNMFVSGQVIPPPQRASSDISTQAITQARMLASDDIKATTGIYDAALGAKSNETSGVAIQRRNVQAQTSNFHFVDNLTRSLRHTGRILIDLIPKVYDTARSARIVAEDGEQKVVKVNEQYEENGKPVLYALDAGKYDVTVDVGPSFQTKRQEAVASMMEITKSMPQLMQIAGDLLIKNMDWPGATDLADRLKKTMDPKLFEDSSKDPQIPPQAKAQMDQMGKMVEQLTDQVHKLQDEKDMKIVELESKERIEMKKLEVQVELKLAELDAKDSVTHLKAELDQIGQRMSFLHTQIPVGYGEMQPRQQQNPNPQPTDGGQAAQSMGGMQDPTGGASPGTPMEGINQP